MPTAATYKKNPRIIYSMRALGKGDPPESFTLNGATYTREKIIKHDFWAATAFYLDGSGRRAVLKMGRAVEFAGMPLAWIGRYLRNREAAFYQKLSDLPNIPKLLGNVGETGFLHDYVPGNPLSKDRPVPDRFFAELEALFKELHRRGIAYLDTNKPQNILQGDDGKPYLIDFQISWDVKEFWDTRLNRWILGQMHKSDIYHILKHKRKLRPDEMSVEESDRLDKKHWTIRVHRFLTKPYFKLRRRTMKRLKSTGQIAEEGSK